MNYLLPINSFTSEVSVMTTAAIDQYHYQQFYIIVIYSASIALILEIRKLLMQKRYHHMFFDNKIHAKDVKIQAVLHVLHVNLCKQSELSCYFVFYFRFLILNGQASTLCLLINHLLGNWWLVRLNNIHDLIRTVNFYSICFD